MKNAMLTPTMQESSTTIELLCHHQLISWLVLFNLFFLIMRLHYIFENYVFFLLFQTKTPTIVEHDSHEYIFEGFSMLSHFPLVKLPTCKVIRFNIEYTILYVDEAMPENFTIRELDLFCMYQRVHSLT